MNMELKQIMNIISNQKNEVQKKELLFRIQKIKEVIEDSERNEILKCILNYFCTDKPWIKEFTLFSEKLCQLNYEEDNVEIILKYFEQFNGNLKHLISIDNLVKNKYILCALKFKLISGEVKELVDYIKKIKDTFKKEKKILEILLMFNFDNFIQINFIQELIRILFIENNEDKNSNILGKIILNINKKEFLRCEKCFDILYCYKDINNNLFTFICNNRHLASLQANQEKIETKIITIKCQGCGSSKHIYENIFKCLSCKAFFCESCKNGHEKGCLLCQYINLCQIGYVCEKHNKLYKDCCFFCPKNLCDDCKSSHNHICKPEIQKLLISDSELLNFSNLKKNYTIKDFINYNYAQLLKFMNNNDFVNLKVFNSLNFLNGAQRKNIIKNFYSDKFGDEQFLSYYKNLLEKAKNGSRNAIEDLQRIYDEYQTLKIKKSKNFKFNSFIEECKNVRENKIETYLIMFKLLLIKIKKSYFKIKKAIKEINDKMKFIEQSNDINFLKIKNIALYNSNRLGEVYLRNLISSYLSDWIIAELINKYPKNFSKIELSLTNIYEILKYYGKERINEETKNKINSLCNKLTKLIQSNNFEIKQISDFLKDDKEIVFIKDLVINDSIVKKEDLNFILELLFFLKKIGNEVAHPNIDKIKASFIKFISKDCFSSENIANDSSSMDKISFENLNNFINNNSYSEQSEQKEKIKDKLNIIVSFILNDFKEITYKKEININHILNFIIKNMSHSIIKEDSFALTILKKEMDLIVNKENETDLQEFTQYLDIIEEFNSNFQLLESNLKEIKMCVFDNYFEKINKDINISITDLKNFDEYKLESILNSFNLEFNSDINKNDKNSCILFVIGLKFLKMKNDFNLEKKILSNKIEEIICEETIRYKIEAIYLEIEKFFRSKNYYINEKDLIEKVKAKIAQKKDSSLFSLDMDIDKLYDILQKVIGVNPVKWLETPISKNISLNTYLYYQQNIQ